MVLMILVSAKNHSCNVQAIQSVCQEGTLKERLKMAIDNGVNFRITLKDEIYYATIKDLFENREDASSRISFENYRLMVKDLASQKEKNMYICFDSKMKFRSLKKYIEVIQEFDLCNRTYIDSCDVTETK
jgi:hypothetical protein